MYEVNSYYQEYYRISSKRESIYKGHNIIILEIESELKECNCPKCGSLCHTSYIGRYERHIEDIPYNFMSIWLHIHAHKFECLNPNCDKKYFDEVLPFARENKVKTDNYIQFILTLSIFLSSTATSLILSLLGTSVSADVVDSIIHKIVVKDDINVEEIGVDDVAIRKGQSYATAIYDLKDHHLITLLDGRDAKEFEEWLKNHPKIKTIARDRASAYATAINNVLPECIQVADRFHLFQNLIEYLKDLFYKEVPDKIFIKDGKILDEKLKKIPKEMANLVFNILENFNYDNTVPKDELGNNLLFDNKLRDFDSKQYQDQKQRRIEEKELAIEVKNRLKSTTYHNTKLIAEELNTSIYLVRKYKKMSDDEIQNIDKIKVYKKRKTKMDDYSNIIFKMLKDEIEQEYIFAYVKEKGCKASDRYLANYINLLAKNNGFTYKKRSTFIEKVYPDNVTVITRHDLLKYLLTLDKEISTNNNIENNINIIFEKYPIAKEIKTLFNDFHYTMFSADPNNLDIFVELYKKVIPQFCNGIKKDIAPVKNAISYEISSGFVEGNNNKFKLIKRIVYGKQKLVNLLKKSYIGFMSTLDTFDISIIVEDILNQ